MIISICISKLDKDVVDITIIGVDGHCLAIKLKGAKVFIISMKKLKFQVAKKAKPEIVPKNVILIKYSNFWIFFK